MESVQYSWIQREWRIMGQKAEKERCKIEQEMRDSGKKSVYVSI
jgi:hypothetical protein